METNVSHSAQKARQVLNIAVRVMCHCQMDMACEQLHNSCNRHDVPHQWWWNHKPAFHYLCGALWVISYLDSHCISVQILSFSILLSLKVHLDLLEIEVWQKKYDYKDHLFVFFALNFQPHVMTFINRWRLVVITWPTRGVLVTSDARHHAWTETEVMIFLIFNHLFLSHDQNYKLRSCDYN